MSSRTDAPGSLARRLRAAAPSPRRLGLVALLVNVELVAAVAYYGFLGSFPSTPRYAIYGLIWVNVGAYVLYDASIPSEPDFRTRRRALAIAAAYFGLLVVLAGIVDGGVPADATDARFVWLPPGWGPAAVYASESITLVLMPAYLIGFLALTKLVYATVLDASRSVVAGVLGLFSCVSCTLPIVAMIASAAFGGTGILAATAFDASYGLSTAVFLLTVGLLYWQPGFR